MIYYRAKGILTQWNFRERVKSCGLDCRIWEARAVIGDGCCCEYHVVELFMTYSQVVVLLGT